MAQRTAPCGISLGVCRVRITLLDATGCIASQADNSYVLSDIIQIVLTPNIETGTSSTLIGGCGCKIASFKAPDNINRYDLTLSTPTKSPAFESLLMGGGVGYDDSVIPVPIGFSAPGNLGCDEEQPPVALEFWTKNWNDDAQDPDLPWIHWVFPQTLWVPGPETASNDFMQPDFAGFSRTNSCWGQGPYNDGPEDIYGSGAAGIDTSANYFWFYSPEDPPTAACAFATIAPSS